MGRGEGLGGALSGPRWDARSHGQLAVRRAGPVLLFSVRPMNGPASGSSPLNEMKGLSILGCTGSVGTNVLRVVDAFPGRFQVVGLAGGRNVRVLAEQVVRYRPRVISVVDAAARDALARLVDLSGLRVGTGPSGMVEVATHEDARTVVASAVGAVGLLPTYRALEAGKDVALANKETLVMA